MRIFDHANLTNDWKCPICLKSSDKPVVLIGICGTEDGNIIQAEQIHAECLQGLRIDKDKKVIYMMY